MMAKLDMNKISLASGLTGVVLFTICYVLYMILPNMMYVASIKMFHSIQIMNQFNPSFSGFILGNIYMFIATYAIGAIFAYIYNFLLKK